MPVHKITLGQILKGEQILTTLASIPKLRANFGKCGSSRAAQKVFARGFWFLVEHFKTQEDFSFLARQWGRGDTVWGAPIGVCFHGPRRAVVRVVVAERSPALARAKVRDWGDRYGSQSDSFGGTKWNR